MEKGIPAESPTRGNAKEKRAIGEPNDTAARNERQRASGKALTNIVRASYFKRSVIRTLRRAPERGNEVTMTSTIPSFPPRRCSPLSPIMKLNRSSPPRRRIVRRAVIAESFEQCGRRARARARSGGDSRLASRFPSIFNVAQRQIPRLRNAETARPALLFQLVAHTRHFCRLPENG